ncbi:hypothetical protein [Actinoplanes subtropicus]|uniref:hypothetical protein n=1 Tax=Actinoplanes subtropicus TaxID=543632 RepID=UPI0004C477C6|nr:hypothetical protein [Actinoplanes subtropicus]
MRWTTKNAVTARDTTVVVHSESVPNDHLTAEMAASLERLRTVSDEHQADREQQQPTASPLDAAPGPGEALDWRAEAADRRDETQARRESMLDEREAALEQRAHLLDRRENED